MTAVTDHALVLDRVTAYAAAVRAHLDDLPPEQLEDLTDGLEADLAEALEDPLAPAAAGDHVLDLTRRFGPAAAYADELRAAAGVSPRSGGRRRRLVALRDGVVAVHRRATGSARRVVAPLLAVPLVRWLVDQAVAMRPLWWVVRGWAVYVIVVGISTVWWSGSSFER